ncbi:hypothetical protein EJ110_NYTH01899 [Nymphaea thermarum]|nr:hypothetical protein EJ110_NYTH01899 [Nymphaea thermarum]
MPLKCSDIQKFLWKLANFDIVPCLNATRTLYSFLHTLNIVSNPKKIVSADGRHSCSQRSGNPKTREELPPLSEWLELLQEQYNSYRMKESDDVMDHVNKMLVMAKDLAMMGSVISDNMQISNPEQPTSFLGYGSYCLECPV